MSEIDELFTEGREIAEHVGMTGEDPNRRYDKREDKEEFIRMLLDYIYWLNQKMDPTEMVLNPKVNLKVVDFYGRASDFGE